MEKTTLPKFGALLLAHSIIWSCALIASAIIWSGGQHHWFIIPILGSALITSLSFYAHRP